MCNSPARWGRVLINWPEIRSVYVPIVEYDQKGFSHDVYIYFKYMHMYGLHLICISYTGYIGF